MKRNVKLLSLLLILALLLGATWAASLLNHEAEVEEDTSVTVFTVNSEDVTAIGWDYSEKLSFTRGDTGWVYDADPDFPLNESYVDAMLETLSQVTASKTIEAVEEWDQYGLAVPVCTVTITTDATYALSIGNETGLGGERYFSIGDGNAYLVDADIISPFQYGLYDVLKYESIPAMTSVFAMDVASGDNQYQIQLLENSGLSYTDAYVWYIDEKPLDTDLAEELMLTVVDLSWGDCTDYHAEDLAAYGLDTPLGSVTIHYVEKTDVATNETDENGDTIYETREEERSFTLEIGSKNKDGAYYSRIKDSAMVYTIPSNIAETLLYTTYYDLQPDEVLLMDWDTVTAMEITVSGETGQFLRSVKTVTDEEGNESEEIVYLLNGEEADISPISDALEDMPTTGYANGVTQDRNEEIRILLCREDAIDVELVFYRYDSTSCLVTLNGEATVFADREAVVELVEEANSLILK